MSSILEGIRVLEWGYHLLGPSAGALLGDLGAEVIKIEDPKFGDATRGFQKVGGGHVVVNQEGRSYYYEGFNRHKKSVVLD